MKIAAVLIPLAFLSFISPALTTAWGADHTTIDATLQISLNVHQQVPRANGGSRIQSIHVGNREILNVLGEGLTNDLSGYRLELRNGYPYLFTNQVYLVPEQDGPEYDVTDRIRISWGSEKWNATSDEAMTGNCNGVGVMTISFDNGHGHSFVVTGFFTESCSWESKANGADHESNSWRMNAAGEGMWDGQPTVFQGVIRGHGEWDDSPWPISFF